MKRSIALLVSMFLVASLSSCAHRKAVEQKVDKNISEVVIEKNETVGDAMRDMVNKSDKLTDDQKKNLLALQEKTHAQNVSLREELEKTKVVLMQTVLEPKMNQKEYSLLRKKINKLEKQRLENGFKAINEIRNIIAPKKNVESREIYKNLINSHLQEI